MWTESDSRQFLNLADVITPSRREQYEMLASLLPAPETGPFHIVELGCGGGELAACLLERIPGATYLGLDGSETMLEQTAAHLAKWRERVSLRPFRLERTDWLDTLPSVHCFVSSLVVHHLDDAGKRSLYRELTRRLAPGGALMLIDIVQPTHPLAVRATGAAWNEAVKQQSQALTGSLETYERFRADGWNTYTHPDPMDMPASLFTQLKWMEEAGLRHVDCFWQRAGHAIFGGYK